jgi:hypothetical protein
MVDSIRNPSVADKSMNSGTYVVVDLGRNSRSEIRDLRKGEGKLFSRVQRITEQLKADHIEGLPVFIVQEKRRDVLGW